MILNFKKKPAYLAVLLALGTTANAERMVVYHNDNGNGLKKGHNVLVEGKSWFAVELDENGKSAIRGKSGFKSMEVDAKRFPMSAFSDSPGNPNNQQVTPYNYTQIQGDQLTLQSGQKVCVIDSGIAGDTGETGGQNNDFNWASITGDSDSGTGDWFRDGGAHGTHVAGTIGAADNSIGSIGVAPGIPMHIIKVFNDAGWGYSSDLARAAELCEAAGANIINMSLSGSAPVTAEENAFDSFRDNGGLAVAAAGNHESSARHYPGGYKSVMMIGGVNKDNGKYQASAWPSFTVTTGRGRNQKTEDNDGYGVEIAAGGQDVLSTVPSGTGVIAALTVDGAGITASSTDNTGTVTAATYFMGTAEATDSGANGKICIIDRGNISFADKVSNCGNSGGVGAVVINNEAGMVYMDISGTTSSIAAVGAALEDRAALVGSSNATIDSAGGGSYSVFSGTSMSTPTVAGAAALVWSNHPTCTGEDIRAAFKASAQDIGDTGRDIHFGYGIAKAKAASDYLVTNGCSDGPVDPPGDALALTGNRSKGNRQANLSWTGGTTANVDVFVNGSFNSTTSNDGAVSFSISKNSSYTFQLCEEASSTECSNVINL